MASETGSTSETAIPDSPASSDDFESDYHQVLHLSTRFFGAQRCGDGHNWTLVDNQTADHCHTDDGASHASHADLGGGWHDAGDFLKFSLTNAWAAYALLKSYDAFPNAHADVDDETYSGQPNGIPDVLDEAKYAVDYLQKLLIDDATLVARVGSNSDHNAWVTSPYQWQQLGPGEGGGVRPVYDGAMADIAGLSAAALALMSKLYGAYDEAAAQQYLTSARALYAYGQTHLGETDDDFYGDYEWRDNMLCGAAELYAVTTEAQYLDEAVELDRELGYNTSAVDWTNAADLCRHSLYVAGHSATLTYWRSAVDSYIDHVSGDRYIDGLAFFGNWGSLRYAAGAAFSAGLLAAVLDDSRYESFAHSQVDYILGNNEYNRAFVVGWGANPPKRPHHKNAYGREALDWDLSALPRFNLAGALVGGPTTSNTDVSSPGYEDDIHDYVGNEVTIEYNALFVGAVSAVAPRRESGAGRAGSRQRANWPRSGHHSSTSSPARN